MIWLQSLKDLRPPGLIFLNEEMKGLLFADNLLLHSPSVEALQESLNILN